MVKLSKEFHSPFTIGPDNCPDIVSRNGQPFTVVRKVTRRNWTEADRKVFDAEVLPVYFIRFQDGIEICAWPEEIEVES